MKGCSWLKLKDTRAPTIFVPQSIDELLFYLDNDRYLVLGNGSNTMVGDMLLPILKTTALDEVEFFGDYLVAEAGATPLKIVSACIEQGKCGFEFISTIPGTIGAMAIMNAGAHGDSMSQHVRWVEVIQDSKIKRIQREQIDFAYRKSDIPGIVARVALNTQKINPEESQAKIKHMIDYINGAQPRSMTLGSTFKNPDSMPAWKLIDSLPQEQTRSENMYFSPVHRNFLINDGDGTFDEACDLIKNVRNKIIETHGIELEIEIHIYNIDRRVVI